MTVDGSSPNPLVLNENAEDGKSATDVAGFLTLRVIRVPLTILTSILLARTLGVAGMGVYSALLIARNVFQPLFRLGIPTGINYFLRKGDYRAVDVLWTCIVMGLIPALCTCLLVVGLWQANWLGQAAAQAPPSAFWLIVATIPVMGVHTILVAVLYSQSRFAESNAIALGFNLAQSLSVIGLYFAERLTILTAVIALASVSVIQLLAVIWRVSKTTKLYLRWNGQFASECLSFGIKAWPSGIFTKLSLRLDHLLLTLVGTPEALGLYSLAVSWNERLMFLPDSVAPIVYNKVCASEDKKQTLRFVARIHRVTVSVVFLLGVFIALNAIWFIPLVYKEGFRGSILLLALLIPGTTAFASMKILSKLSTGLGRPALGTKAAAIGALVGAIAYGALVPRWFELGAAVGSVLCYGAMAIALAVLTSRMFDRQPLRLIVPSRSDIAWAISQVKSIFKRVAAKF